MGERVQIMIVPKTVICHPNNIGPVSSEFCPVNFS